MNFTKLSLLMVMLIANSIFVSAYAERAKLFNRKGRKCGAVGIKDLGEYLTRKDLKCFRSVRRAKRVGYYPAGSGILAEGREASVFEFNLSGTNVVPPTSTSASGSCTGVLNAAQDNFLCCVLIMPLPLTKPIFTWERNA